MVTEKAMFGNCETRTCYVIVIIIIITFNKTCNKHTRMQLKTQGKSSNYNRNKTAELSQRRPRDAPNIWVP